MRERALELLEQWNNSYSDLYKELRVAYRFLREGKRMKFPELQVRAARERSEATRREKNAERLLRVKYFQAKREIQDQISEIETMVQEMQGCYDILVPAVPGTDALPIPSKQSSKRKMMFKGGSKRPRSSPPPSPDPRSDQNAAGWIREVSGKRRASMSIDGQDRGHVVRSAGDGDGDGDDDDGGGGGGGLLLRPPPRRTRLVAADGGPHLDNKRRADGSGEEVRTETWQGSSSRAASVEDENNGDDVDEEADGIEWEDGGDGNVESDGSAKRQGSTSRASSLVTSNTLASLRDEDEGDDDDDNIEWEDGEGGDAGGGKDTGGLAEDERENSMDEEADGKDEGHRDEDDGDTGYRSREYRTPGRSLLSLADTVEAAGLGSRGYELQLEISMRWSLSTDGAGGEDTALVLSTLRERYKVLTSRVVPLLSDWIRTLSRVTFDEPSLPRGTLNTTAEHQRNMEQVSNQQDREGGLGVPVSQPRQFETPGTTERSACAELLRRCLSTRNSVNTVVSKFLELKIDQDERRSDRLGSEKSRKGNGRSDNRSGSGNDKSTNAQTFRLEF